MTALSLAAGCRATVPCSSCSWPPPRAARAPGHRGVLLVLLAALLLPTDGLSPQRLPALTAAVPTAPTGAACAAPSTTHGAVDSQPLSCDAITTFIEDDVRGG